MTYGLSLRFSGNSPILHVMKKLLFTFFAGLALGLFLLYGYINVDPIRTDNFKSWVNSKLGIEKKIWKLQPSIRYGEVKEGEPLELKITSPVLKVDKIYKSMLGPLRSRKFEVGGSDSIEVLWMTGYALKLIEVGSKRNLSENYLCHNNLAYKPDEVYHYFNLPDRANSLNTRLITLSPGLMSIHFPKGFGLPFLSNQRLEVAAQVLNLNEPNADIELRHVSNLKYVSENNRERPMKPLYQQSVYITRPVEGENPDWMNSPQYNPGCLPAKSATLDHQTSSYDGTVFTSHWVVKPGREVLTVDVTEQLNLPFNTTIHYISAHLHAFAETLTLRDVTADTILFQAVCENYTDRMGLKSVNGFSSPTGIPVYRNHRYELISVTDNTSGADQDMMAVFYMYLHDKDIERLLEEELQAGL